MKIILVEDEAIMLQALKCKIEACHMNCEIIATAENGAEALELIEQLHPDVFFTDIRMPVMDGLTLIKKLHEHSIDSIPVILSGYDDFLYAQQAIRMNVNEYLLKPVDMEELRACLEKCRKKLAAAARTRSVSSLMFHDQENIYIPRSDLEKTCSILYFIFGNPIQKVDNIIHPSVILPPGQLFEEFFQKELGKYGHVRCMNGLFTNEKAVIICGGRTVPTPLMEKITNELAYCTEQYVTAQCQFNINSEKLSYSARICRKAAVKNVVLGISRVYLNDSAAVNEVLPPVSDSKLAAELYGKDYAAVQFDYQQMFAEWERRQIPILAVSNRLTFLLQSIAGCFNVPVSDEDLNYLVENCICFSKSMSELADNFYRLTLEIFENRQENTPAGSENLVNKIEEYFRRNIGSIITLQDISDHFGLSKVTLCRAFKQVKQTTPILYFNEMKINHAKMMLIENPDLAVQDIAERLGFNDIYYFSKFFKKHVGQSPTSYRKSKI